MLEEAGRARAPILIGLVAAFVLMAVAIVVAIAAGGAGEPFPAPTQTPSDLRSRSPVAPGHATESPSPSPTVTALACSQAGPPSGIDAVLVYFMCGDPPADPRPVSRDAAGVGSTADRLRFALEQLLAGPSAEERDDGFSSVFAPGSDALLIGVEVSEDGRVVVAFSDALQSVGALNSSHNRFIVFATLGATIAGFEEVVAVEYLIEGSCEQFSRYFEGTCRFVRQREGVFADWLLIAGVVDGARVEMSSDWPITLVVEPTVLRGEAPCNSYGAPITLSGEDVELGAMDLTEVGCPSDEVAALERSYLGALVRTTTMRLHQGNLVLTGPGVELNFAPLSAILPDG